MQKILKITQQTFWQIVVKIVTTVSGFIILGIVSRNYGESGTGDFTLALTYLAFFYVIADFGFNAIVLQKLDKENILESEKELGQLFGLRIIWGLILVVISVLLSLLLPTHFSEGFKISVILGSLIIFFYAINQTAQTVFQNNHRYDLDILPTILGVATGTLLIYFFGIAHFPIYVLILGYTLAWFIHTTLSLIFSLKITKYLPIFSFSKSKTLFEETWPIAATLVLNTIYFRVDSFILSYYYSSSEVGIYNLAYQFFQAILVLPTFIMNSFYPMMLDTFKNDLKLFFRQIKYAAIGLFILSIFISLLSFILSPFLIRLITGSGFSGSISSLQILSLGFPAFFLSALLMWLMVTKKMFKPLLYIYIIGLLFNSISNLIFIPQNSFIAASWITGISEYLILVLQIMVLWLL